MKKFSRALIVPVALLVANASAVCPLFSNKTVGLLSDNKNGIGAAILADKVFDKNEHAKKAFVVTLARSVQNSKCQSYEFAERLAVDYAVRKGSDVIGLNGYRDAIVKKLDVMPAGMVRDLVHPIVEGVAEVATHPETLTYVLMNVVLPMVMNNGNNTNS
jgi:hypothetical protein